MGKGYISESAKVVGISNPTTALKLLRNFGHLFEDLAIDFNTFNNVLCGQIELYLGKYCSASLQRMSFRCNSVRTALDGLQTPLINLNLLRIEIGSEQHPDFGRLNAYLPMLRFLYVHNHSNHLAYLENTHFDNVEFFGLKLFQESCTALPFSFNKLKYFYQNSNYGAGIILNKHFCETFSSAKHLTELELNRISSICDNSFAEILQSENFLTNIEEITVHINEDISPKSVIRFLNESKSLKKFTFYRCYNTDQAHLNFMKTIKSLLNDKWTINCMRKEKSDICCSYSIQKTIE